jgi:uridine kinase
VSAGLISSDARRSAVAVLAREIVARRLNRPLRVALDGRTASGKTTLARELAEVLRAHGPVAVAPLDGFHRPREARWAQGRTSAKGYYEDARDHEAVRRLLLDPLGPGGDRMYRTRILDLETDLCVDQEPAVAAEDCILLVEGSFLQRPELVGGFDVIVLVDAPRSEAIERGARRDAAALGGLEAATSLHACRYATAWDEHYAPSVQPREGADIIFDNADPDRPGVEAML